MKLNKKILNRLTAFLKNLIEQESVKLIGVMSVLYRKDYVANKTVINMSCIVNIN